jgi:hypothetical protein
MDDGGYVLFFFWEAIQPTHPMTCMYTIRYSS